MTTTAPKWHEGRMVGFDTETTGTNVHEDRIITASIVFVAPGQRPRSIEWIIDPGIDVPTEASAVHGWTRDRVLQRVGGEGRAVRVTTDDRGRSHDMPMYKDGALGELAGHLAGAMHRGEPLVIANAAYDVSLTETELARNGIDPIASRPTGWAGVVDPMVLNKQWDPYRKTCYRKGPDGTPCDRENGIHHCGGCRGGKHGCRGCGATDQTLGSLCAHYGVVLAGAHSSTADALAAVRIAKRLGGLWADAGRLRLSTLHSKQVEWRRDQMIGLRDWFDKNGTEHDGCCGEWPLHTACVPAVAGVAS